MKIKQTLLIGATVVATSFAASAQQDLYIPNEAGFLARAHHMYELGNYAGTIDQLRTLDTEMISLPTDQQADALYLLASSLYNRGDRECLETADRLVTLFPESQEAVMATMLKGDFHFFHHEWPDALIEYQKVDVKRLPASQQDLCTYRTMLSLIKTGHYKEARQELKVLASKSGYKNAYTFYTAYLDYINGDFNKAYSGFASVPEGIEGLNAGYYLAQIEFTREQYSSVISRCRRLLAENEDEEYIPETERIMGLSLFKTGDKESAVKYLQSYEKRVETPTADAIYALGSALYDEGDYLSASSYMSRITDQENKLGQGAWLYLGQCALKQGNLSEAALAFEKAARMDEDKAVSESALYNYAATVTRGGKVPFSSSADLLEKFAAKYPDSEFTPSVEEYLATAYYNDHNYEKALRSINAIRNPSQKVLAAKQKVLYELGVTSLTSGKPTDAARYLEQCTAINSGNSELTAEANLWLGDARYSLGKYSDAAKCYTKFLNGSGSTANRAAALYGLAYSQYKQSNYSDAAKNFSKAMSTTPALPATQASDAMLRYADCLYYTGKYSDAATIYAKAASQGVADADYALYREAVMAGLAGNTTKKLQLLNQAEKEYPGSRWLSQILLEEARTYEETGHSEQAAEAYKKRLLTSTDVNVDELFNMASTMHNAGKWNDLLEVTARIRRAGQLDTDELADLDLYDADAYNHTGQSATAAKIYQQLAGTPTSLTGSKAAVSYGHYLLSEKRYADAEAAMLEFTDSGTPYEYWLARGYIILADAYSGLGKDYLAKEYLTSLKENYPGDEDDIADMIATRLKRIK
jgi:TolA-binding protein